MKNLFHFAIITLASLTLLALQGCKDKSAAAAEQKDSPAGETSDAVQEGAKKVGDSLGKAYDNTKGAVKDGVKKAGDAVSSTADKAGDALKSGVRKTGEALDKTADKIKEITK